MECYSCGKDSAYIQEWIDDDEATIACENCGHRYDAGRDELISRGIIEDNEDEEE